jgi:hypothetical protein
MNKGNGALVLAILLGSLAFIALPAAKAAQQATTEKPVVAHTKRVTVSAEVIGIDKETRTVTLRGKDGKERQVKVGSGAKNFDQIKVGDTVTAEYFQSAAVSLRKQVPGEPTLTEAPPVVQLAPRGEKPAGVVAQTINVTALVENVDHRNREVTLKGPSGDILTLAVDKNVQNFDQVQKGDHVVVTYSEAIAVQVTPKG